MKKSNLLIGLLASCALLGACSTDPEVPASSSESSVAESSVGVTSKDRYQAMSAFVKNLAENNYTLSISGIYDYTVSYIGDAVVYTEDTDSWGYLTYGDVGVFSFELADGAVSLGQCAGIGELDDVIITPYFVFGTSAFTSYYDYKDGPDYTINFDLTTIKNSTYGAYFLYYLSSLLGVNGSYYSYVSDLSLTLNADGTYAKLDYLLTYGTSILSVTALFSDFGTTTNDAVSAYLADLPTLSAPTDFSSDIKAVISTVFGDNADKIVFPTGLVTAAYAENTLVDDSDNTIGIEWIGYGDDITAYYAKLLIDAGFEESSDYSGTDSYGYTHYGYTYTLTEETDEANETAIICDTYYVSSASAYYADIYLATLPRHSVDAGTVAEINEGPIADINAVSLHDVPELTEDDAIIETYSIEYAGSTGYEDYTYYTIVELAIDEEADAIAYGNAYGALVMNNGYTKYDGYTLEDAGSLVYYVMNSSNSDFANYVQFTVAYDDDGGYEGYAYILYFGAAE